MAPFFTIRLVLLCHFRPCSFERSRVFDFSVVLPCLKQKVYDKNEREERKLFNCLKREMP